MGSNRHISRETFSATDWSAILVAFNTNSFPIRSTRRSSYPCEGSVVALLFELAFRLGALALAAVRHILD
jgi:hypothetical protein